MPLPAPTKAPETTPTVAAAAAAPVAASEGSKIKQFGPAKDANDNEIPAPKPLGVDLVEFGKSLFGNVNEYLSKLGVDATAFLHALELNTEDVPGHKAGRITYGMASVLTNIAKYNGLATKERGAGGFAKMKADIEKKDAQVQKLREQLLKLGMKAEDIDAQLSA